MNRADYTEAAGMTVLLDGDGAVRRVFGVHGTPGAVLIGGVDGRLLGPPAGGEMLVRRLLAAALSGGEFDAQHAHDETGEPAESITAEWS